MINQITAIVIQILLLIPVIVVMAWVASHAVGESQKRGYGTGLINLFFFVPNPLSGLIRMMVRPDNYLVERSPESYENSGDAFAAASTLEELGEWEEAIVLLKYSGKTWPQHIDYANNCIQAIRLKQSLASKS